MEQQTDDGSLAFLNIPRDENNRSFNCDETSQSKLVNTEFWIIDFIEEVPTRFSKSKGTKGQTLVKIKDDDLLWLLDEIIDSADGLPIGNYLSQYLANLYLCYFMHKANEEWKADCAEYADDIVFFSDSKEFLHKLFHEKIRPYIENELELEVKSNFQVFPIAMNRYDKSGRALDYVGYKFYRGQKLIRKSIKQNFCRAVAKVNKIKDITPKEYKQTICSWLGWAKHSNSKHLLQTILRKDYYDTCVL